MTKAATLATTDVVVVGAGITGLSTAYELRKSGFSVVVVEQRFAAFGASGRNAGAVWLQTCRTGTELDLARAGKAKLRQYVSELGDGFEYQEKGGLFFFETEAQGRILEEYVEDRRAAGLDVSILSVKEAQDLSAAFPATALGAVYCADDAQIDSQKFVAALSAACIRSGVRIFQNTAVLSELRNGPSVTGVKTIRGDILASGVVWATGAWITGLGNEGAMVPVGTARMGQVVTQSIDALLGPVMHGPRGVDLVGALRDLPGFTAATFAPPTGNHGQSVGYDDVITQNRAGSLFIGHSIDAVGSLNPHISMAATQAMISTTLERFPGHAGLGVTGLWAGLMSTTPDGLPILDRVDGVYVNVGHTWGVATGPISGQVMAEIISGERSDFADALSIDRSALESDVIG
ncbi:FAD-binding oxidoreductase [Planosporangium thailandense]|uniref:FAD-binding oxidoreductase n=1 Tax=Planosporangium thailandense TaxID=765197 RepID=A0ABX0XXI2_9ACTN|nr:FAD-binding oxidoreductase [Planosporangium thailandense]